MSELTALSARELSAKLKARDISAVDLMRATLDRIAAVNGTVNAIVSLRDEDALMAEAANADQTPRKGWLHGIPHAMKEPVDVQGLPTTWGSPLLTGTVAGADDLMTRRIKDAGAIIIGKTNMPEFGLGSHTFNPVYGSTLNPYDRTVSCGGSSGGAAVALATRMLPLADGSDVMGSLRNPAAWNNVYGMRPTHGLVPAEPAGDMFLHQLFTAGPMARDPTDLARLLETQAGPDPRTPQGRVFDAASIHKSDMSGKRIGWLGDWGGAYPYEPGISEICTSGLEVFERLGAIVEPVAAPFPAERIWEAWINLRAWSNVARLKPMIDDPAKRDQIKASAQWEVERGLRLDVMDLDRAAVDASDWYRCAAGLFSRFDALVLPTAQVWPFPHEIEYPTEIAGRAMDTYHRWMEVVIPVSLIGLPSISLPVGFGDRGLPMGMQLFGPRWSDGRLLSMVEAYHQATDWPGARVPDLG